MADPQLFCLWRESNTFSSFIRARGDALVFDRTRIGRAFGVARATKRDGRIPVLYFPRRNASFDVRRSTFDVRRSLKESVAPTPCGDGFRLRTRDRARRYEHIGARVTHRHFGFGRLVDFRDAPETRKPRARSVRRRAQSPPPRRRRRSRGSASTGGASTGGACSFGASSSAASSLRGDRTDPSLCRRASPALSDVGILRGGGIASAGSGVLGWRSARWRSSPRRSARWRSSPRRSACWRSSRRRTPPPPPPPPRRRLRPRPSPPAPPPRSHPLPKYAAPPRRRRRTATGSRRTHRPREYRSPRRGESRRARRSRRRSRPPLPARPGTPRGTFATVAAPGAPNAPPSARSAARFASGLVVVAFGICPGNSAAAARGDRRRSRRRPRPASLAPTLDVAETNFQASTAWFTSRGPNSACMSAFTSPPTPAVADASAAIPLCATPVPARRGAPGGGAPRYSRRWDASPSGRRARRETGRRHRREGGGADAGRTDRAEGVRGGAGGAVDRGDERGVPRARDDGLAHLGAFFCRLA